MVGSGGDETMSTTETGFNAAAHMRKIRTRQGMMAYLDGLGCKCNCPGDYFSNGGHNYWCPRGIVSYVRDDSGVDIKYDA
jgi:hypothetical protein